MLISIRERVRNKYREQLSEDVPDVWKFLVKRGKTNDGFSSYLGILKILI